MKKLLSAAVFTVITAVFAHGAGVPVQNMTPFSLGLEYHGTITGHPTLYNFDSSSFVSHFARLHYSPFKFLRLSGGIGGSHAYNSANNPMGDNPKGRDNKTGFSATGGAALFLPKLLPVLSITAGYDGSYLKYGEEDTLYILNNNRDTVLINFNSYGKTIGKLHAPYAGLIFHPNRFMDVEIGGMYKIFEVTKTRTNNDWTWVDDSTRILAGSVTNSVGEQIKEMRIYGSVTLHEPRSGAYLSAGASAAPKIKSENRTNNYLTRSSMWLSIGAIIRDPRYGRCTKGEFSDSYLELKQRQNEMAQELLRDIDREIAEAKDEEDEE